jgi:UDP-N-acetylmuramoyl-L-alanyl-D-glutamate--2,6-diaminopimelate ligase
MHVCPGLGHLESLRKLVPHAQFFGADDIGISGCKYDWSQVRPGDLFIVWDPSVYNISYVIGKAVAQGCVGILCERQVPECNAPVCVVPNAREAYGLICQALAGCPSDRLKLIGVSGANGKTTTSCLIAGILAHAGHKVGHLSTLGYFDGQDVEDANRATPQPDRLAKLLARMVRNGCSHAVMNVSEQALAQSGLAGVRFDAGCVTNITRDYLDDGSTARDYRLPNTRLLDHLHGEAFMVVNADDPLSAEYLRQIDGPALTVGIDSPAEIIGMPIEQFPSEQTFLITAGSDTIPVRTKMIGRHHIYNCLEATAVGLAYGIELPKIVRTLEAADYVPGRLERIECGQPFSVFVDFVSTPDALAGCLHTLKAVSRGRLICLFGTSENSRHSQCPLLGRTIEQNADMAVITSSYSSDENSTEVIEQVLSGFERPDSVKVISERRAAIHYALSSAKPGDCVLIAGETYGNCQLDGEQDISPDDHQIAREWLYEVKPFSE